MSFLVVYVKEAHPEDGWVIAENRRSGIAVHDPTSHDERARVASACAVGLRLTIPTAIDGTDNAVTSAYGGWPDRLYLVGADGRIAYQGGPGPFGFKPGELDFAIRDLVSEARTHG